MQQATTTPAKAKRLTYGQSQALKVLVADKMGLHPHNVDDARKMLRGSEVHPVIFALVDQQASEAHNALAGDETKVAEANAIGKVLLAEFDLA